MSVYVRSWTKVAPETWLSDLNAALSFVARKASVKLTI